MIAAVQDITKRKSTEEELRCAKTDLQHLAAQLIQAQEEERQRIARELHDDIGQRISMAAMDVDLLIQDRPILSAADDRKLPRLLEDLNDLATDVHELSHSLHSSILEHLGLGPALNDLCRQLSKKRFKVKFDVEEALAEPMSRDSVLCLYRVAQEALSNGMKHSNVQQAALELVRRGEALCLTVKDGGIAFDLNAVSQGLGLASMKERLRMVNGKLTVRSGPGNGTELMAEVPLQTWNPQAKAS